MMLTESYKRVRQLVAFFKKKKFEKEQGSLSQRSSLSSFREMPTESPLARAIEKAYELMQIHGLVGWTVKLDNARRRAGQCDFRSKVISLSRHYVRSADPEHIHDTILHEIAHALVGPKHGHDRTWKNKALELGCSAKRCHTLNFFKAPWRIFCPNGCFNDERHRRKKGLVCAKCRASVVFVRSAENNGDNTPAF